MICLYLLVLSVWKLVSAVDVVNFNGANSATPAIIVNRTEENGFYSAFTFCTWVRALSSSGPLFVILVFPEIENNVWPAGKLEYNFEKMSLTGLVFPGLTYEPDNQKFFEVIGEDALRNKSAPFHICMKWDGNNVELYLNGKLLQFTYEEGPTPSNKIPRRVIIEIGRMIDEDDYKSFYGSLYQLNMWSKTLNLKQIEDLANCLPASEEGDIISWSNLLSKTNVTFTDEISFQSDDGICRSKESVSKEEESLDSKNKSCKMKQYVRGKCCPVNQKYVSMVLCTPFKLFG